jgi:tetratricopeptide (TPR) repeat protein
MPATRFNLIILSLLAAAFIPLAVQANISKFAPQSANELSATENPQAGKKVIRLTPKQAREYLEAQRDRARKEAAMATYQLSILAVDRNDLRGAFALMEEVLALFPHHLDYLTFAADIRYKMKQYARAEALQKRAIDTLTASSPRNALRKASELDRLSAVLYVQNKYDAAGDSLQQGLMLREQVLGKRHMLVVVSLNKLASLAIRQKQRDKAESYLKTALKITRELSGEQHTSTANVIANLADFYLATGRQQEAQKYYRQALTIWQGLPGALRQRVDTQNALGRKFLQHKRLDDARMQFRQVLFLLQQSYVPSHPMVVQAKKNLAALDTRIGTIEP